MGSFFSKNTVFSGLFFFFVLFALFVLRPFRNTIAADIGTANLTFYLFIIVLVMLLVNPVYSYVVSRINQRKIVPYIYGFFIINLLIFLGFYIYFPELFFIKTIFYIWYNVFNFFIVAIFWALTVTSFDIQGGKKYFGLISAFGSLGAASAGSLVNSYLYDKEELALFFTLVSLCLAVFFASLVKRNEKEMQIKTNNHLEGFFEQFEHIKKNPAIRVYLLYTFVWTCLTSALWFFQLEIVNTYTSTSEEKTKVFGQADQFVPLITLFVQIFLTSVVLRSNILGIKFVLTVYGILFLGAFLAISGHFSGYLLSNSGVVIFLILQGVMRPFEYGLNKPARETVYTTLTQKEKYKSTVFIDTFTYRFGDATGGLLFNTLLTFGIVLHTAPLAIIPLAIFLVGLGVNMSKNINRSNH